MLIIPLTTLAIGISASPAALSIRTTIGKEGAARFTVSNPSREVGLFEVYPEEFEKSITLIPNRFVLEAGAKREVTVLANGRESGAIRTVIAIEAQPLGVPAAGVGGGIRLPFYLETSAKSPLLSTVILSGVLSTEWWLLIGALTVLFLLRRVLLSTLKRSIRKSTLW